MQKNIKPKGMIFFNVVTSTPKIFGDGTTAAVSPSLRRAPPSASALHMNSWLLSLWEMEIVGSKD